LNGDEGRSCASVVDAAASIATATLNAPDFAAAIDLIPRRHVYAKHEPYQARTRRRRRGIATSASKPREAPRAARAPRSTRDCTTNPSPPFFDELGRGLDDHPTGNPGDGFYQNSPGADERTAVTPAWIPPRLLDLANTST
jgi:hypothetical protein